MIPHAGKNRKQISHFSTGLRVQFAHALLETLDGMGNILGVVADRLFGE